MGLPALEVKDVTVWFEGQEQPAVENVSFALDEGQIAILIGRRPCDHAAGLQVATLLTLFHVLLALVVIACISVVGIVLVNALLVIPAATAKLLARSRGHMFVLAPLFGIGSVLAGLIASYWLDAPSGPAIVVTAGIMFLVAWGREAWRARRCFARTGG
jgi:ABC-type Mn2+/Zn2+ transport system permease subunit